MDGDKKSNGTLVGVIIIIIILIIGAIYTWQTSVKDLNNKATQEDTITNNADELNTLEQDLNTADTDLNVDVNNLQ